MAKEKVTKAATATATAPTTTTAAAPAAGAALAAARAQRDMIAKNDRFVFKADLAKGAPQAKAIVDILKAAGAKGLTREELVGKMTGVVVTRQPMGRILGYYQKDLVAAGAIEIQKAQAPTPTAVAA